MLAEILVLAAGAVAVAVLAVLQWYLSGRALNLAHTSQELFDLFSNRVLSAGEHLPPLSLEGALSPATSISRTSRHPSRGEKCWSSCAMADKAIASVGRKVRTFAAIADLFDLICRTSFRRSCKKVPFAVFY
jgi:hypothetical protein